MTKGQTVKALMQATMAFVIAVTALVFPTAVPTAAAAEVEITISGHGFGHGRGMGQWGAYGYATSYGWGPQRITNHFYGGTRFATDAGNPTIDVALLSRGGSAIIATGPGLSANSKAVGAAAVRVTRTGTNAFRVDRAAGCGGPWTPAVPATVSAAEVVVRTTGAQTDPASHVALCESGRTRGYRGALVLEQASGAAVTTNRVGVQDYLRGVLPKEVPAAWGSAPNGIAALQAQAVAARSYALSGTYKGYATTCDTTACQVYGGSWTRASGGSRVSSEHPNTDRAVALSNGHVRRSGDGRIARTEFSASTGGWSAGGQFPAVQDLGDGVTANPNRSWSVTMTASQAGAKLGTGPVTAIDVTSRNGYGEWGGRVLQATVRSSTGSKQVTGDQLRTALGLKSTWILVRTVSEGEARAFVRAAYVDVLGREADAGGLASWTNALVAGASRSQVGGSLVRSDEHVRSVVGEVYLDALRRPPAPGEGNGWVDALQEGGSYTDVAAKIYASPESLSRLGGGDTRRWVAAMYQAVLGRAPEAGAVDEWTQHAATRGRYSAAKAILASREARTQRAQGYYQQLLGRPADPGGLTSALGTLADGRDLAFMTTLVASTEYYQRAQRRYPS